MSDQNPGDAADDHRAPDPVPGEVDGAADAGATAGDPAGRTDAPSDAASDAPSDAASDAASDGDAAPGEVGATPPAPVPAAPADPVQRELAPVAEVMDDVRRGVPSAGEERAVPTDEEVAALEHAHEVLRSTLDRVDRGG